MKKLTAADGNAETELHAAAWSNDTEIAGNLLSNGIDVNVTDSIGESPLHGAAAWGHLEMVNFLLAKGANPNIKNNDGDSPIHWACSHGTKEVVQALIGAGAQPGKNRFGQSPLEIAKSNNKHETIKWLKQNT